VKSLRVLIVLGVVLVVSLIAGAYAAGQEAPPMTGPDAREFTIRALTFSGFDSVEVTGDPRAELFNVGDQPDGERDAQGGADEADPGPPIPVWVVPATVSDQQIELYVARQSDRAVNLDDALPGGGFVLTEEQFARLESFRLNPASEQLRTDRQGPAVAAGVLIVVAALLLIVAKVRGGRGQETSPEVAEVSSEPAVE
jgi:hypothetical protein